MKLVFNSASLTTPSSAWRPVLARLRFFFDLETEDYLRHKFEDHRSFMAAMYLLAAVLGPALWIWDLATDPVGAQHTWPLRLVYLAFAGFPLALKHLMQPRLLAVMSLTTLLIMEAVFLEIMRRLDQGMTYGIGGYVIFMFLPLVLLAGFSLRLQIAYSLLAAATPQWLALAGEVQGFQHSHYAVLIWPVAVTMVVVEFAYSQNYWRRYNAERALEISSRTDPLTGLANRRHFIPLLRTEIARSRRTGHALSLLMMDIDHFKLVNDMHGHASGDRAIRALGHLCQQMTRETDTVARMGGEEFAVLLPATNLDNARALAERLRRGTAELTTVDAQGLPVWFTLSIGVAEWTETQGGDEALLAAADARLYRAKAEGRNRVVSG